MPAHGLPRDVLVKGSATNHAVFASVATIHKRINETLFDRPQDYASRFATKPSGDIDPRPRCQGFYAAMAGDGYSTSTTQPRPAATARTYFRRGIGWSDAGSTPLLFNVAASAVLRIMPFWHGESGPPHSYARSISLAAKPDR